MDASYISIGASAILVLIQFRLIILLTRDKRQHKQTDELYERTEKNGNRITKNETEIKNLKETCSKNHRN